MSISSEITRITNKRDLSLQAVEAKGVTVPTGSTIDDLPGLIAQIQQGSGGGAGVVWQDENGGVHFSDEATSGSGPQWDLIGTYTHEFAEYTDTTNIETTDTEINISNTDYAWGMVVITCDSAITTTTEWGMTFAIFGRYTSNSSVFSTAALQQRGSSTLSKAAMVSATFSQNAYGVWINNNTSTIVISRKCHGTGCPKIRAGIYTVKIYGLKSL